MWKKRWTGEWVSTMSVIFVFWKMCRYTTVLWRVSRPEKANVRQHLKETVPTVGWTFSFSLGPQHLYLLPIFGEFSHFRSFGGRQNLPSTLEGENARYLLSPGHNHRTEVYQTEAPALDFENRTGNMKKGPEELCVTMAKDPTFLGNRGSGALAASTSRMSSLFQV